MRRVRLGTVALAIALAFTLAGCVTTAGGTLGEISRTADGAASDVRSAQLALSLLRAGKATTAVTTTALGDTLSNLADAQSSTEQLSVATARERAARIAAQQELARAITATAATRDAATGTPRAPSLAEAGGDLREAAAALTSLARRLGS